MWRNLQDCFCKSKDSKLVVFNEEYDEQFHYPIQLRSSLHLLVPSNMGIVWFQCTVSTWVISIYSFSIYKIHIHKKVYSLGVNNFNKFLSKPKKPNPHDIDDCHLEPLWRCGIPQAIPTLSKFYTQFKNDILVEFLTFLYTFFSLSWCYEPVIYNLSASISSLCYPKREYYTINIKTGQYL